ncbi:MAG: tRNA guanosine(15) transglycosylase TgtA [Candidatus Sigynarchaeota archaeon]
MASFEILAREGMGRLGKFEINGKSMLTPNILPVVHPKFQIIHPAELRKKFGVDAVFTNAYIIFKDENLRLAVLDKGVHAHLGFPGIIATDSGAFQHYMYGTDDLKAEDIEPFQEAIGSDLGVILDQPVQVTDARDVALAKVRTTLQRAADNVQRRKSTKTQWYGPIHGSRFHDLLEQSAIAINGLDYAVHALGGVVKLLNDYQFSMVARIIMAAKQHLDPSRPVHLFGAGHPMVFALFVALGCDLFDSAAYSLFAKEGRYITAGGTWQLDQLTEFPCSCPTCAGYTPAELRAAPEDERIKHLSAHNLHASMDELRTIREYMRAESLWQLVETRCRAHPKLLDALRVASSSGLPALAEEPVFKQRAVLYAGPETLARPDVVRYREYIAKKYEMPDHIKIIVILPELDVNAVASPQHQQWREAIDVACASDGSGGSGLAREHVLIVIINPVLGLIPEDLLSSYPASHNVFPETLDLDQQAMMEAALAGFLQRARVASTRVIAMVPETYRAEMGIDVAYDGAFLRSAIDHCRHAIDAPAIEVVTSPDGLREALARARLQARGD